MGPCAILPAVSSVPSAPAAGKLALYARTRAGQPWLDAMRPNGRDFSLQPHLGLARPAIWLPSSGATITSEGMSNSTVGTVSTPGLAATSLATSMRRWRLTSAATADSASDQRSGVFTCWRGNAAGLGGWTLVPPHFMPVSAAEIIDYYRTIDAAVGIPVVMQDIPQAPVPPDMALRLAEECRNIRYIKVETLPTTAKVADNGRNRRRAREELAGGPSALAPRPPHLPGRPQRRPRAAPARAAGILRAVARKCLPRASKKAGDRLFTFSRLDPSQWKSTRTTNANHREIAMRSRPSADVFALVVWWYRRPYSLIGVDMSIYWQFPHPLSS